jgi:hypothetical protein
VATEKSVRVETIDLAGDHGIPSRLKNSIGILRAGLVGDRRPGLRESSSQRGLDGGEVVAVVPSQADATEVEHGESCDHPCCGLAAVELSSVTGEVLLVLRGATFVAVVEATEFGKRDDAAIAWRSDRPRDGRVFVER